MPIKPIQDEHVSMTASALAALCFKIIKPVNQLIEAHNAREEALSASKSTVSKRKAKSTTQADKDKKVEE